VASAGLFGMGRFHRIRTCPSHAVASSACVSAQRPHSVWLATARWTAIALVLAAFAGALSRFEIPGKGFTYLIHFGALEHDRFLAEVKAVNHYELPGAHGYDGEWCAQIAMHPQLRDPALRAAVDNLPYRARRILFEWSAWLIGGGDPLRVMRVFAVQNLVCWFALAGLLLRWFPPTNWGNVLRWAAILFSFGLIFSVRDALLDGPDLLLVATAVALVESGRPWSGAFAVALAGLGKDTGLFCGAALVPFGSREPKVWTAFLTRAIIAILPLVLWALYLEDVLGSGSNQGLDNFAMPPFALLKRLSEALSHLCAKSYPYPSAAKFDMAVLLGLLAQFGFFVLRPRPREPWWRVGASYALLMLFLGTPVWEGYPSAAARVLLPMTLAFNVQVPRGRGWFVLLLVGNLGALVSFDLLRPPERIPQYSVVDGPRSLAQNPKTGYLFEVSFVPGNWDMPEKNGSNTWRWSSGDGLVRIRNPHDFPVKADITFGMATAESREIEVRVRNRTIWRGTLDVGQEHRAALVGLELPPGDTELALQSDRPASQPQGSDTRRLSFSVRNFRVVISGRAPPNPL
jgi:hypothetical protein